MWGFSHAHAMALSDLTRDLRGREPDEAQEADEDQARPAPVTAETGWSFLTAHPWHPAPEEVTR